MLFFRRLATGLALLTLTAAHAADSPPNALRAADPEQISEVPPLRLPEMGTTASIELPADADQARAIWQRANQSVAEFPRGHVDLLRWEARQPAEQGPLPAKRGAQPMSLSQALRHSLRNHPELFLHADMNAPAQAQLRVRFADHVRDVQRAWIDAATARQRLRLMGDVLEATRTGSELGQRMVSAGNWSQARLTRERLLQARAWSTVVEAQAQELSARERLARLLGLWQAEDVARLGESLPESLPAVPKSVSPGDGLDATRLESTVLRSDPALARDRPLAQRQFDAVNPERWQAWNQAVEQALQALPEPGTSPILEPPRIGDLSLLRDHSLARAAQAESDLLRQAADRRSMAREAWARLQLTHATAIHTQDVVVQLQGSLAQESLLRYNGMLQSTWELLASARERLLALDEALLARRDFWRAQADWQALLAGASYASPGTSLSSGAATAAPAGH